MKQIYIPLCLLLCTLISFAEMRIWTDRSGRKIEAALIEEADGKVTLKRANGSEGRIPIDQLSEADQAYLAGLKTVSAPPAPTEKVRDRITIKRRKLLVNGEPYRIKGICYSPAPKGSTQPDYKNVDTDLALMKEAGINTVRIYAPIKQREVLDKFEAAGIKIICGWGNGSYGVFAMRNGMVLDYVRKFHDHNAILFWELGNENNYHPEWFEDDIEAWYRLLNQTAYQIKLIDPNRPVSTANGELPEEQWIKWCNSVDIWGMNVYRWDNSVDVVEEMAAHCRKPFYISETGCDRYMSRSMSGYQKGENEDAQADAVKKIVKDILAKKNNCLGLTLFEFNDEWWKAGKPHTQDPGDIKDDQPQFPYDANSNEEYWGIVDIDRNKKKAFEVLKKLYTK